MMKCDQKEKNKVHADRRIFRESKTKKPEKKTPENENKTQCDRKSHKSKPAKGTDKPSSGSSSAIEEICADDAVIDIDIGGEWLVVLVECPARSTKRLGALGALFQLPSLPGLFGLLSPLTLLLCPKNPELPSLV